MLLFYPELSQRVVGQFYCEEIGSKWYMSRDKSLLCYEGEWMYYLPLTAVLGAVWVIGTILRLPSCMCVRTSVDSLLCVHLSVVRTL